MTDETRRYVAQLNARMWDDRFVAVLNLAGYAGDPVVQPALLGLLDDIDYRVRRLAVRVLSTCAGQHRVRIAFQALLADGDPEIRKLVSAALEERRVELLPDYFYHDSKQS